MNSILFSAVAFGFLFSLADNRQTPGKILQETFQIYACVAAIAGTALLLSAYVPVNRESWAVWMIPAVFAVCSLARRPFVFFLSVCGLSFRFLEPASADGVFSGVLTSAVIFAGFRIGMFGFGERTLFFKPLKVFAGMPMQLIQAFWTALIISAWALLPYLRG